RELTDQAFDSLLSNLKSSPDSIPKVPNVSPEDVARLMESLQSMYAVQAYHEVPLEEFVSDIADAFRSNKELDSSTESKFRVRLAETLNIAPLRVAAKAALLHADHEHTFCTARILSDIRPVYDDGVKGPPSGAIITHTLKLDYHDGPSGELSEIYIVMG